MAETDIYFETTDQIQEFIRIVGHFTGEIDIRYGSYVVDGKSILGVESLGTHKLLKMHVLSDDYGDLLEQIKPFIREP